MPEYRTNIVRAGNNIENLAAFWIASGGPGARWGVNGEPWDGVLQVKGGTHASGLEVAGIGDVEFQVTIPAQEATIVYDQGEDEIIIVVTHHGNECTIEINVNN